MNEKMGIGGAVEALRAGRRVRRAGWNGVGLWLGLCSRGAEIDDGLPGTPEATLASDGDLPRSVPFVFLHTSTGEFVPWVCSQTDLLADDWESEGRTR